MTCLVIGCDRGRAPDAPVCRDHLNDLWGNRLELTVRGYVERYETETFVPEWRRRAAAKDLTGAAA